MDTATYVMYRLDRGVIVASRVMNAYQRAEALAAQAGRITAYRL